MKNRIISIVVVLILVISNITIDSYATEKPDEPEEITAMDENEENKQFNEEQTSEQDEINSEGENEAPSQLQDGENSEQGEKSEELSDQDVNEEASFEEKDTGQNNEVQNGVYFIRSSSANNKVLDILEESFTTSSCLVINTFDKKDGQKWKVSHDEKGYITIVNDKNGKALEAVSDDQTQEVKVIQNHINDTLAQKWIIKRAGTLYQISPALYTNYVLDIRNEGNSKEVVKLAKNENVTNSKFQFIQYNSNIEQCEEIVPSGIYYIYSASNSKFAIDIKGGSIENKANVQLYKANGSIAQAFELIYSKGFYTIKNICSGRALDVENGGYMPGTNVWQFKSNDTLAQKWSIEKNEDGSYTFISALNGMALDVYGGKIGSGSNIQIYTPNKSNAQKFTLHKTEEFSEIIPSGNYYILSKSNQNYAIDIEGGSEKTKANVQLYTFNHTIAQAFNIKYSNGSYTIRNLYSNKMLDVQGGGKKSGTNVWQYTSNGTKAQKWKIRKNTDGSYSFINMNSELALDIKGGKTKVGTNIQAYKTNNSNAQKYILQEANDCYQGVYYIKSAASYSEVLDVKSGSLKNGANVQVWNKNSGDAQKWSVRRKGSDLYGIISAKSGKALDVYNGTSKDNTNVWQYGWNDSKAQQWKIVELGDGTVKIVSALDDSLVLSIVGNKVKNGANVVVKKWSNLQTQKWKIEKTTCKNKVIALRIMEGKEYVLNKGTTSTLHVNEICTSTNGGVTWTSSNSDILSVDAKGKIRGIRSGNVTVTARSKLDKNIATQIKIYVSEQSGELSKQVLDNMKLDGFNKLMIVAHPDDETFWGGGHLLEDDYLVVCITNGWNPTRKNEFYNAMQFSKERAIILDYPDLSDGAKDNWNYCKQAIQKDIELLVNYKSWEQIVTHNPDGEYGHIHHKMLNRLVSDICNENNDFGKLFYFGVFWKANEIPEKVESNLMPLTILEKRKMAQKYPAEYKYYLRDWVQMEPYEYWIKASNWKY